VIRILSTVFKISGDSGRKMQIIPIPVLNAAGILKLHFGKKTQEG